MSMYPQCTSVQVSVPSSSHSNYDGSKGGSQMMSQQIPEIEEIGQTGQQDIFFVSCAQQTVNGVFVLF